MLRGRLAKILRPALPAYGFLAVVLIGLSLAGVGGDLVDAAAAGAGTPLWFIAAFVVTQAGVQQLLRLHERAPVQALAALVICTIVVELARGLSGVTAIGYLNIVFLWLAVQQLGFWYADGFLNRRPALTRTIAILVSASLLAALLIGGAYSPNLLRDQSPPSLPLLVIAPGQLALLAMLSPFLRWLLRFRAFAIPIFLIGSRALTFYLWNLPVMLIVTGIMLLLRIPMPAPYSWEWWLTRIPVLIVVVLILIALAKPLGWFERGTLASGRIPAWRVWGAAVLGFIPAFIVQVSHLALWLSIVGTLATAAALLLLGARMPAAAGRSRRVPEAVATDLPH